MIGSNGPLGGAAKVPLPIKVVLEGVVASAHVN